MSSPCERSTLLILLFALIMYRSFARDNITPDQSLGYGEKLVSAGGTFALGFFSPKNTAKKYVGIWHNKVTVQTIVWVANRQHPITSNSARLTITLGGSLVITDHNSTIIWSAVSTTVGNPIAQLLDTGNFVVWDAESSSTVNSLGWQSFDYPTDTLLPGMKLGWDLKTGTPHNLTSWKSESDPSPGPFCLAVDKSFEVTEYNGSKIVWRSGMWNGITFNGIPDLRTYGDYVLTFVNNTNEFYLSFQIGDPSTFARIHMSYNGTMDRYVWVNSYNSWDLIQSVPRNPCDPYRVCGTNAYCDSSTLPLCHCIDGFVPKSPANWTLGDATEGCIRKTALACAKGSDGFMKISNMAVPDVATAKIDSSMSLDECRANCLRNCSCWGYANSDIRGAGSGCVMWAELTDLQHFQDAGQDLYVRLADSDLGKRLSADFLNRRIKKAIAITVSLVLGSLLLSCIIYFMWRKKKAIRKESWNEDKDLELPFLPLYDLEALIAATHNFSMENRLGEGGFGTVYKGMLPEGQEIAVKRLSKTSRQGVDEFKNEVSLIAKLQHRNLVRLLGCCTHGEERMLIYEYMPNKSLDAFLFDKAESTNLGWGMRFSIITGIARGLLYLHQDSRFRIIHRDLKASNVLLDGEMNPKISDFGLARIFGTDEATARTRRVVGTYGYMSPEYAMDGIFSVKSDVFSFGVLVLEIVSGQRTKAVYFSEPEDNLLRKAWRLWSEDKGLELIDPAIGSDYSMDEVIRCIKIGLLCVQENPRARPNMSSVVHMLSDREGTMIFEPQQPGFMARNDHSFPSSSSTNQDLPSINAVTVSLVAGR